MGVSITLVQMSVVLSGCTLFLPDACAKVCAWLWIVCLHLTVFNKEKILRLCKGRFLFLNFYYLSNCNFQGFS